MQQEIYINNLGIINALGATKEDVAANLLKNSQTNMVLYGKLFSGHKTFIGAVTNELLDLPKNLSKFNCRNNQLLATAYTEIKQDVETFKQQYGADRIGVILGTSTSGIAAGEQAFKHYIATGSYPKEYNYQQQELGRCSEFLAKYAGVTGPNYTISTACSSSGKAFAAAARLLKTDTCDAVIVGGSDSLCELTLNGFDSLELIAPNICNPFSINRNGINIGEGAALFIMSKNPSPIKFLAAGESSDGYHITAPDPKATGAKLAISEALKSANLKTQDIGYINLHGTATQKNDAMESLAIHSIFGEDTLCSSTKPLTGHTLGAAAAQELALCWLLLSKQYNPEKLLPPQLWDQQLDSELAKINLISNIQHWTQPIFMSNSFAFGGNNVSLIIGKETKNA